MAMRIIQLSITVLFFSVLTKTTFAQSITFFAKNTTGQPWAISCAGPYKYASKLIVINNDGKYYSFYKAHQKLMFSPHGRWICHLFTSSFFGPVNQYGKRKGKAVELEFHVPKEKKTVSLEIIGSAQNGDLNLAPSSPDEIKK